MKKALYDEFLQKSRYENNFTNFATLDATITEAETFIDIPNIYNGINEVQEINNLDYTNLDYLINNSFISYIFMFSEPFKENKRKHILKKIHFSCSFFLPLKSEYLGIKNVKDYFIDNREYLSGINSLYFEDSSRMKELDKDIYQKMLSDLFVQQMEQLFQMPINEIVEYMLKNNTNIKTISEELFNFVYMLVPYIKNSKVKTCILKMFETCCKEINNEFPACVKSGLVHFVQILLMLSEEDRVLNSFKNDKILFSFLVEQHRIIGNYKKFYSADGYLTLLDLVEKLKENVVMCNDEVHNYMKTKKRQIEFKFTPLNIILSFEASNSNYYFDFINKISNITSEKEVKILNKIYNDFDITDFLEKIRKNIYENCPISFVSFLNFFKPVFTEKIENNYMKEMNKKAYNVRFFSNVNNYYTWKFQSSKKIFKSYYMYKKLV
jgi:hypothetical protein